MAYIVRDVGLAVRYFVAPVGTAAADLGQRELLTDPAQARMRAEAQGLAVFTVKVTVAETTEV